MALPGTAAKRAAHEQAHFAVDDSAGNIAEGIPVVRSSDLKAWVSIMYGCNNFCSYCIVPYVRGRERSRRPEEILEEVKGLIAAGYKDITLLGQNVNSYGKDLGLGVDFADLMAEIAQLPGEFWLRFMTSHPKDASKNSLIPLRNTPRSPSSSTCPSSPATTGC